MVGDSPSHLSARPPERVAPVRDAAQETADEEQLQLPRTLELRLAPEQLAALVEIHRAVAGHLDRRSLFTAIAQALQGVVPVSRSLLLLPSSDPAALTIYASYGKVGLEFYQGQTIARAGSIPGWVVEHGRPFVVDRGERIRERFPVSYQRLRQWGMESVAVVPLLTEGRCVGALSLMSEHEDAWSGFPPGLLDEIAASIAVAVEHCVAYEALDRLRDEQAALLEINRAVARHLHRDELFATLAECLRDLLPCDRFGIELPVANGKLRAHVLSSRNAKTAPAQIDELPSAGTACRWTEETRQWFIASSREELRERFPVTFAVMQRAGMQSVCAIPLLSDERSPGVLFFMAAREAAFHELRRDLLEQVGSAVAVALDHCLAYEEVRDLRDRFVRENVYLQEEIRREHPFEELVGSSPTLGAALHKVDQVAPGNTSVLILGETGTGKELIARAIHNRSARRDRPLVKVNCSAISAGLVESELFGHMKGAFTGALERRVGRFELADGGTIFLDEIGELPLETQVKLLRVLQEREFEPVGSSQPVRVNVRVIAATNRNLEEAIQTGSFRSDLFYRLNVFPIEAPPLRERRSDIPKLARFFLSHYSRKLGKNIEGISQDTMDRISGYSWPGNVRELQNIIERAAILCQQPILELNPDLAPISARGVLHRAPQGLSESESAVNSSSAPRDLSTLKRGHIMAVLKQTGGVIEGPKGAAKILNLHPNTLRHRISKLGIKHSTHRIS